MRAGLRRQVRTDVTLPCLSGAVSPLQLLMLSSAPSAPLSAHRPLAPPGLADGLWGRSGRGGGSSVSAGSGQPAAVRTPVRTAGAAPGPGAEPGCQPGRAGERVGNALARTAPAGSWSAGSPAGRTARALHLAPEAAVLHALCSGTLAGEAASGRLCLASLLACGQLRLSQPLSGICRVAPLSGT